MLSHTPWGARPAKLRAACAGTRRGVSPQANSAWVLQLCALRLVIESSGLPGQCRAQDQQYLIKVCAAQSKADNKRGTRRSKDEPVYGGAASGAVLQARDAPPCVLQWHYNLAQPAQAAARGTDISSICLLMLMLLVLPDIMPLLRQDKCRPGTGSFLVAGRLTVSLKKPQKQVTCLRRGVLHSVVIVNQSESSMVKRLQIVSPAQRTWRCAAVSESVSTGAQCMFLLIAARGVCRCTA